MFDPTVFENLKVAFENQLYDLDNLDARISVIGREDMLDLAVMSRRFVLRFALTGRPDVQASVVLEAGVADLSAEILETPGASPACTLLIRFTQRVNDVEDDCARIERVIRDIWGDELPLKQTLSRVYGELPVVWAAAAELRFNRRINEDQMGDLPELIAHMLATLERLNA